MTFQQSNPALACNIHAIPHELRPVHQANTQQIFTHIQEVRELPTGYAWRLPNEMDMLQTIVAFLGYERLCCPFFRFALDIEPDLGPIWLHITGATDMKALIQSEGWVLPANNSSSKCL